MFDETVAAAAPGEDPSVSVGFVGNAYVVAEVALENTEVVPKVELGAALVVVGKEKDGKAGAAVVVVVEGRPNPLSPAGLVAGVVPNPPNKPVPNTGAAVAVAGVPKPPNRGAGAAAVVVVPKFQDVIFNGHD